MSPGYSIYNTKFISTSDVAMTVKDLEYPTSVTSYITDKNGNQIVNPKANTTPVTSRNGCPVKMVSK